MPSLWRQKFLDGAVWIFPGFNALYDTAFALMATKDFTDEKFNNPAAQLSILGATSVFSYAQSITFNGQKTVDGIKETLNIISARQFPENWPKLAKKQDIAAITLATLVMLSATLADYFGAYYSVNETPQDYGFDDKIDFRYWAIFATFTGIIAGLTSTFTEGIGFYRILRSKFAGEEIVYHNRLSKFFCYALGYPISILAAAENMMTAYAAMKTTLSPNSPTEKYAIMSVASPKLLSDFYFAGKECRDAVDAFVGKLSEGLPTASEMAAFTLSSGAAYLVTMPEPYLTRDLMSDPSTSLPFTSSNLLTDSLSYGVALRDGIVQTHTLYPLFYKFTNAIDGKIRSGVNHLRAWCGEAPNADANEHLLTQEEQINAIDSTDSALDEVIIDIPPPGGQRIYINSHPNVLFQPVSPNISPKLDSIESPSRLVSP